MAAILVMAAIGAWAILTHRFSYIVTSGVSMEPTYHANDLVFVVKADSYQTGQIAAYRSPSGLEVLHRIFGGDPTSGFVFKGDNNRSTDAFTPTAKKLIGRAVLHIPKGGVWLKPLLGPTGLGMMSFLIVGNIAVPRNRREIPRGRRKKKVKAMAHQGGTWATALAVLDSVKRLPPVLRAAAVAVAVLALFALTLGVLGWMKPITETRQAAGASSQSMAFSYSATVPRSPAYDGTVVTSPDPIFRKLAHRVDVRMRYQGQPGTFEVTATLTNGTGWHTTMQLATPKKFTGSRYEATVTLDLDAIDHRAKAATDSIGIEPAPVLIALAARVSGGQAASFTAPLQLNLAPLQLSLATGVGSLTVSGATATSGSIRVPRRIDVFGFSPTTAAAARSWATLMLIAAACGATVLFLAARRKTPLRTRSAIERRYPQLLIPIEPLASPPGKPVVTVDNFPALVRLAERYGQMILTWSRSDADDFVVRDEGITYRYRIPLDEPTLQNVDQIDRPPTAGIHRRKASVELS